MSTMHRRMFLFGATVVAAGGAIWKAEEGGVFSAGQGPAYAPWTNWREQKEGPLALVAAAILAASPHNTQPWIFRVGAHRIELLADTHRNLGPFDPFLREMHVGLGCALENLALAASANGLSSQIELIANSPVAIIHLTPGPQQESELYNAIPHRHTNRRAYDVSKAVKDLPTIEDSEVRLFVFTSDADRMKFGEIVVKATERIVADAEMMRSSEQWTHLRWNEVQEHKDGVTLDAAGINTPLLTIAKMFPSLANDAGGQTWLKQTREVHAVSAPLFGMLAVRDRYDRKLCMRVGRVWQRLHLWATSQGLAAHPLNQPIEVADREKSLGQSPAQEAVLASLIGDASWQPTFGFRLGWPTGPAGLSPRRSITEVIAS